MLSFFSSFYTNCKIVMFYIGAVCDVEAKNVCEATTLKSKSVEGSEPFYVRVSHEAGNFLCPFVRGEATGLVWPFLATHDIPRG